MASKCMFNLTTFAAVSGLACSLAPASVTIYGGPTWDRTTDTGYWLPHIYTNPGASAGNGTAIGCAEKRSGGAVIGWVAVRWDASGNAASELGDLGIAASSAYAVNSAGTAVGWAAKYVGGPYPTGVAVRWDAASNAATELGNLGTDSYGNPSSEAFAVNDAGTAVGWAKKYSGGDYIGDPAVRWDASGTATELGSLGNVSESKAYAINSTGTAVGYSVKPAEYPLWDAGHRAVRWDASGTAAIELGNLGTDSNGWTMCEAYALNVAGTAVGYAWKYSGDRILGERAVRWDASGTAATELGTLGTSSDGFTDCSAIGVDAAGTAVGNTYQFSGGIYLGWRAVRWDPSGTAATELGNLGTDGAGRTDTYAYAINSAGTSVGFAAVCNWWDCNDGPRAVYWGSDGVAIDLNTLLSPADAAMWTLTSAVGISDTNWVTGIGFFDPDGPGGLGAYDRMFLLQLPSGSCLSDFNHDGFVNGDDYDLFASLFDVADPGADINSDGFVNGDDYDAFAEHFDMGC